MVHILRNVFIGLMLVFLSWDISSGDDGASDVRTMMAVKTETPPRIDGSLDDPCWKEAQPTSDFILREPEEGIPAPAQTVVRVLYDEKNLYIGLEMLDGQPEKIEARLVPRDGTFHPHDHVGIVLDTYHDHQSAYGFWINPYGIQNDFTTQNDGADDWWGVNEAWDGVWTSEARITDRGWTAEIAIPFKTLRFSQHDEQIWGINIARHRQTGREESFWSFISRDDGPVLKVSRAGHLAGLKHLRQGRHLELLPYAVGGYRDDREESDEESDEEPDRGWDGDVGLDIKYGITSNLTMDLTLNPDFAQIESDEDQINLSRFEEWMEERRPFFLEGKDLFTPMGLFYSRRVQNPDVGAKITGKSGAYNIGFLAAKDSPEDTTDSGCSVLRVKKDILKSSSAGILVVGKQIGRGYHRAAGMDMHLNLKERYKVNAEVARSFNRGVHRPSWKYNLNVGRESDQLQLWTWTWGFDPEFNVDEIGYAPHDEHVGERGGGLFTGFSPRIGKYGIKKAGVFQDFNTSKRTDDDHFGWGWYKEVWMDWENRSYMWFGRSDFLMRHERASYRGGGFWLGGGAGGEGFYRINVHGGIEDHYDFDEEYFGSVRRISGQFELDPVDNLSLRIKLSSVWEYLPSGKFDEQQQRGSLRFTYLPTRDLFVRGFLQINPTDREGSVNLLLSYTYRPGSHFYVAYTESRNREGGTLRLTNRVFMTKVNVLWNL